jgi:nucleotide-binding universal stress UspA family protein
MTTSVLVPLDGSDKDERALGAAAAVAHLAGGDVHLIRVLDTPVESLSSRARSFALAERVRHTRRDLERNLQGIANRLTADTGRPVTAEIAEGFDVGGVLVTRAAERTADLVVMATRASGPLGRALRGSVADRVVRESRRPVVLIPPVADDVRAKPFHLRRALVPLDGSELALATVDQLLTLQRAADLEYVLLEVVTSGFEPESVTVAGALQPYERPADVARARANAEQRLNGVADRLRARGVKDVRIRVVEAADPAAAIAAAARDETVDFIAMSTRGAGGLKRFVLGSVAERVVRNSDVPVMLVTPTDR